MGFGRKLTCLLGIGLLWFLSSTTPVGAEDVSIQYRVLKVLQGFKQTTWTLELELRNLSGEDLNYLSLNLLTSLPFIPSANEIGVGMLYTTEPQILIADFAMENDSLPPDGSAFGFILRYQTTDGIPRSAMIHGQAVEHIGESAP